MTPSGLSFTPNSATISAGDDVQLKLAFAGSVSGDNDSVIGVEPNAAVFELAAVDSNNDPRPLNSRTYVDDYGILHTQKSLDSGDIITVTATSAWINPSGATTTYTATFTATVS